MLGAVVNPQGLSPQKRKGAPNPVRPACFLSSGFLLVFIAPSRRSRGEGGRRKIDLSSVVAEGAKEEATKNAAGPKPNGKRKKPLRREAGRAEMESA